MFALNEIVKNSISNVSLLFFHDKLQKFETTLEKNRTEVYLREHKNS